VALAITVLGAATPAWRLGRLAACWLAALGFLQASAHT